MSLLDWDEIRSHYRVKDREFPMLSPDTPTFMGLPHARSAADLAGADAVIIVVGQNSPCSSYAIAKPIAERTAGKVGMVSLDTHWDCKPIDWLTKDPRIAGSGNWRQAYEGTDAVYVHLRQPARGGA